MTTPHGIILISGASGYVGGRLLRALGRSGDRRSLAALGPGQLAGGAG